jgi:hypothetical protein
MCQLLPIADMPLTDRTEKQASNFDHRCTQMHADKVNATGAKFAGSGTFPLILSAFICVHLWSNILSVYRA